MGEPGASCLQCRRPAAIWTSCDAHRSSSPHPSPSTGSCDAWAARHGGAECGARAYGPTRPRMLPDAVDALASHNRSTQDEERGEQLRRQLRLRGVAAERWARQSATAVRCASCGEIRMLRPFAASWSGGLTGAADTSPSRKQAASIMRICIVDSLSAAGLLPP
jgi:hypothetical protein